MASAAMEREPRGRLAEGAGDNPERADLCSPGSNRGESPIAAVGSLRAMLAVTASPTRRAP